MEKITRLFDFIQYQKDNYPLDDALAGKENGEWIKYSTDDYLNLGNKLSRALLELGVQPGDRIGLVSNNRPEWNIVDLAVLQIGAINVPIYPTISSSEYEFIFNDAEIKFCFVSDTDIHKKVNAVFEKVSTLQEIFSFDSIDGVRKWTDILDVANIQYQEKVEQLKSQVKGGDLATLIYTSGTTGLPKGVMLSHNNLVSNVLASQHRLPLDARERALSFLPLCHVYERILSYLYVYVGVSIYYAESIDTISDNLKEIKPDGFSAVPRLLEKIYDKIVMKGAELTGIKKGLFFWALDVAKEWEPYQANGAWYEFKLKIANKLIFSKWREALGGNVKVVASGSAALQPRLARIFNAAGVPVMEGYGLTETSPVITVNMMADRHFKIGTVGKPIDKVQVKIAEDGEVLCKGPNVMMGYYNNEEKTKEVLSDDGWFHTGDIGEIDSEGFLKITDRKKEIFKTSGGKYVAPQLMENTFKASMFIEQIMVIGENRKHPSALIVPSFDHIKDYYHHKHIEYPGDENVLNHDVFIKKITKVIGHYNEGFGKWEQIKKWEFLSEPFSIDGGELTPTLKLKRKAILSKYEEQVNKIYSDEN